MSTRKIVENFLSSIFFYMKLKNIPTKTEKTQLYQVIMGNITISQKMDGWKLRHILSSHCYFNTQDIDYLLNNSCQEFKQIISN